MFCFVVVKFVLNSKYFFSSFFILFCCIVCVCVHSSFGPMAHAVCVINSYVLYVAICDMLCIQVTLLHSRMRSSTQRKPVSGGVGICL